MKLSKATREKLYWLMVDEYERNSIMNEDYKSTADKKAISIYNKYIISNKGYQAAITNNYGSIDIDIINDIISFLAEEEKEYKAETFLFVLYYVGCDCTLNQLKAKYPFMLNCAYDVKKDLQGLAWSYPELISVSFNKDLDNIYLKA